MRTNQEIIDLVKCVAINDERIRAVLLNGSRANPHHKTDRFSDFDITFVVQDFDGFVADRSWIDIFGERLMMQTPNEMIIPPTVNKEAGRFSYLMLFKDFNRIDLTLFSLNNVQLFKPESLTVVLSDKDGLFKELPAATNTDYLILQPLQKEFSDCCNEFWWVSTYVAKGLCRGEIIYSKIMLEQPVRNMFYFMLAWYAGVKHNYPVDAGKSGKYLLSFFDEQYSNKIIATYPTAEAIEIWKALFLMTELFRDAANKVAAHLHFTYNAEEDSNICHYLSEMEKIHTQSK